MQTLYRWLRVSQETLPCIYCHLLSGDSSRILMSQSCPLLEPAEENADSSQALRTIYVGSAREELVLRRQRAELSKIQR